MKIGFIALPKQPLSIDDVRFAAEHGFHGLELIWDDFTESHFERRHAEKKMLREHGVTISAGGLWRQNPIHPDREIRARCHTEMRRYIDYCSELEVPVFISSAGTLLGPDVDACVTEYVRAMAPLYDYAKTRGVRFSLYGVHGSDLADEHCSFLQDQEACERLWRDLPDATFKFDAANWMPRRLDFIQFLRQHARRVSHVHIKELLVHDGENCLLPAAGMGDVPFPKILAFLHDSKYAGELSIEPYGPWRKDPELRRRMLLLSKRYLEQFIV